MSRPRKNERVIYLASIGHTMQEIAALENISDDTLRRRFVAECEKRPQAVRRPDQAEASREGTGSADTTMLIWLGKQLLGQLSSGLTSRRLLSIGLQQ